MTIEQTVEIPVSPPTNGMPQTMTLHEKLALNMKVIELEKQGKFEEAAKLHKTIPIPPYMAKWAKKRFGAEILLKTGCNLAEAEKEYGHGWLNR